MKGLNLRTPIGFSRGSMSDKPWKALISLRLKGRGRCPACYPDSHIVPLNIKSSTSLRLTRLKKENRSTGQINAFSSKMEKDLNKKDEITKLLIKLKKEFVQDTHPEIDFKSISPFSTKILTWKCKKGHIWEDSVHARTHKRRECPTCKVQTFRKERSLASKEPDVINDWDYEENELKPEEVFAHSHQKFYFFCRSCGKSYLRCANNYLKGTKECLCCCRLRRYSHQSCF